MKYKLILLIFFLLVGCGAPTGVLPTATPLIYPLPTPIPTATPAQPVLPSATIAPSAIPSTIPTATTTPSSTSTVETGPTVWDICPKADRTVIGQELDLNAIDMKDPANGWALDVKGHVLHSHDGGTAWQNVTPPSGQYPPGGYYTLDALNAWAAPVETCKCTGKACSSPPSYGMVFRTTDGGKTWQEGQPFPLALAGQAGGNQVVYFGPVSLQFVDAQTGWLLAAVNDQANDRWLELFQTADGGKTWHRVADHNTGLAIPGIQGIAFLDAQTGWLAVNPFDQASTTPIPLATAQANQGEISTVLKTTDGGRTWSSQSLPVPQGMSKILDYAAQGEVKCGVERVQAWPPDQVAVKTYCHAIADQVPLDYNDVFYSGDGGRTWQNWIDTSSVDAVNPTLIWHLSSIGSPSYGLWWSDGNGNTWNLVREVTWQGHLNFVDALHGWVIAVSGSEIALVTTADGGKNWKILHPMIGP